MAEFLAQPEDWQQISRWFDMGQAGAECELPLLVQWREHARPAPSKVEGLAVRCGEVGHYVNNLLAVLPATIRADWPSNPA